MTRENRNEAAVSETVGYVLLFAIVTLSMGVIYAIGFPVLQSNIDANIFESAEQSFIVLQSNMDRVAFDQTPVKVLKINLMNSAISVSNHSSITIDDNINPPQQIQTGEIVFEKDGQTIAYEMGGVFKEYSKNGAIMVSEPPIYIDEIGNTNVTTISLVTVNGDAYISGKGITSLILKHNSSSIEKGATETDLNITINSIHAPEWETYLEDSGFTIISSNETLVSASKESTTLILSQHVVDVNID